MRLTPKQKEMLRAMSGGRLTVMGVHLYGGARTARSLEDKGLVRHYPYGDKGCGTYGLTAEGREMAARLTTSPSAE